MHISAAISWRQPSLGGCIRHISSSAGGGMATLTSWRYTGGYEKYIALAGWRRRQSAAKASAGCYSGRNQL